MAKRTFTSVTEELCGCEYLNQAANDPESPIVFDRDLHEFQFESWDSTGKLLRSAIIYHCPFCGGAAPKSNREARFTKITTAEESRLRSILDGIRTLEHAIEKLGEPDKDDHRGITVEIPDKDGQIPRKESFRVLQYFGLSETAEVWITDYHKDEVHITFQSKPITQKNDREA